LNGAPVELADLAALALTNYGHFTTMQVESGRVRGLDLHLSRLERATDELFGTRLDTDSVRRFMRSAVRDTPTCALRVTVFSRAFRRDGPSEPVAADVLMTISAPRAPDPRPARLKTYRHERALPHVKHVGTFALFHHRRLAQQAGYDDALFVDGSGAVSEASIWNVGFFDGERVVWPNAPALHGVSMQLLELGLREQSFPTIARRIGIDDLSRYRAAFLTHSSTPVRPIASIDEIEFAGDDEIWRCLREAYEANALQSI
jgi:branched-subunit amino acid aminotransferase/4-amino-4-deoxychorismate lyase